MVEILKALSIKQPYGWLIFHGKDIENRSWPTGYRGPLLIHVSLKPIALYEEEREEFAKHSPAIAKAIPRKEQLEYGGIIGIVDVVDCVTRSKSPWYDGDFGFVLRNPRPLPFIPYKGKLGFFYPEEPIQQLIRKHL
jgi:hypothetical protein